MSFGFGFGLPSWQALSGGFTPASLFSAGEQGAWYDPTDVNVSWRRNLLTYTEQFDNAAWTKQASITVTANSVKAPDGTLTADTISSSANTSNGIYSTSAPVGFNSTIYVGSIYAKSNTITTLQFGLANQNESATAYYTFDLFAKTFTVLSIVGFTSVSAIAQDAGDGWVRCIVVGTTPSSGVTGVQVFPRVPTGNIYLWGAQLEQASTASLYQQIVTPEITYLQTIQPSPVLFTDSAGTTPVTGVEQFVGLMLDKSKGAPTTLGGGVGDEWHV